VPELAAALSATSVVPGHLPDSVSLRPAEVPRYVEEMLQKEQENRARNEELERELERFVAERATQPWNNLEPSQEQVPLSEAEQWEEDQMSKEVERLAKEIQEKEASSTPTAESLTGNEAGREHSERRRHRDRDRDRDRDRGRDRDRDQDRNRDRNRDRDREKDKARSSGEKTSLPPLPKRPDEGTEPRSKKVRTKHKAGSHHHKNKEES